LAGASLADVLGELTVDDEGVMASVGSRLAALLRLEPDHARELAARVAGADDRATSVVLGALAAAGTAETQAALVELLGTTALPAADRAQVAVAMAMVEHPGAELTQALRDNLDATDRELRNAANLALGVTAARLAGDSAEDARSIVDELLCRLAQTSDPEQRCLVLRALGNTADPRALPALRGQLLDAWPRVRGAAVEALHAFSEPIVDALIVQVLASDPDASVRRAAVLASSLRPLAPLLGGLGQALGSDREVSVRLAIVHLLGQHLDSPEAAALLDRAARRDATEDVRAEARRLLASSSS